MDLSIIFWIVGGLVGFLVLLSLFYAGYVIAPPNQAVVITGGGKQRVLLGEAGWMVPFLSTRNYISVEQFKTDVKTSNFVPTKDFINVKADAAVTLKIGTSEEMLRAAAENFLNWNTDDISAQVTDVLEGNLREIIGQMNLREMVNNRQEFAGKVQENVSPDLAKMGIEVIAFTVQSFEDQNNVIIDLGVDNIVAIKKDAAIARAIAEREEKETKAEQDRLANEARVKADLEISQRQTDLTIKQAELQAKADAEIAKSSAVLEIETERQRKTIDIWKPMLKRKLTQRSTKKNVKRKLNLHLANVKRKLNCTVYKKTLKLKNALLNLNDVKLKKKPKVLKLRVVQKLKQFVFA